MVFVLGEVAAVLSSYALVALFLIQLSIIVIYKITDFKLKKLILVILFLSPVLGFVLMSNTLNTLETTECFNEDDIITAYGTIETINEKEGYYTYIISDAEILSESGNSDYCYEKAMVYSDNVSGLKLGNRVCINGTYKLFNNARNPGNFDSEVYYNSLGIYACMNENEREIINNNYSIIFEIVRNIRARLTNIIDSISKDKSGIFNAIVVGDKTGIDDEQKTQYQIAGISHILAVSGLHISIIGISIYSLFRRKFRFLVSAVCSGIILILFCFMCQNSVSVVRAVTMFIIKLVADVTGRRYDLKTAISISAILLLIDNPLYIYNNAFKLSFGAVSAIAFVAVPLNEAFNIKNRMISSVLSGLCITMVTTPFVISMFYEISVYSVILNIIVIPLMSVVLASGFLAAIAGCLSMFISKIIIGIGYYILCFYDILCVLFELLPFHIIVTGEVSIIKKILYFGNIVLMIFLCGKIKNNKKIRKRFIVIICIIFLFAQTLVVSYNHNDELMIVFMDVDQGDGILIRSPNGLVITIDGGSTTVDMLLEYRLESCIKYYGISEIDYSVITHCDTDHISGIIEILSDEDSDAIKIKTLVLSVLAIDNEGYDELKEAAESAGTDIQYIGEGMEFSEGDLSLKCIHPNESYETDSENDKSIVLDLNYKDIDMLLTGDLEATGEQKLLEEGSLEDYDVLKVGHHGSKNSSLLEFLEAVNPEIAVISAGVDNCYGHPHAETIERLENIGADIYCTADDGAIILYTDGKTINMNKFLE